MKLFFTLILITSLCFAASKRQDIIVDANTDKIMGAFVFDKINTYMKNNYGTNLLQGNYQYDIEIIERVVDHLNKKDRQFIESLAGEFDKEIKYSPRSLLKNFKDLRMRISIKDIEYKLSSLSPDFTFQKASSDGFTFRGNFKSENVKITFEEIHFSLEIPVDCIKYETIGTKECSDEKEQLYWGPEFILKRPSIQTKREKEEPLLEFDSLFKIVSINEHELAPQIEEINFAPLVKFMQDYKERIHFSFNPEKMVIPTFSMQVLKTKVDLLHQDISKENIKIFVAKNEERIRDILVHQIEEKLSGDINEDDEHAIIEEKKDKLVESDDFPSIIKKNIEKMRFERDYLMSSEDFASLLRIEELLGDPFDERVKLVLPNFLCISDRYINELKELNERRLFLEQKLQEETVASDKKSVIEGLQKEKEEVIEQYRYMADLCKVEDKKRYKKTNGETSTKPEVEQNGEFDFNLFESEEGLKISVTSGMMNNILQMTYDAGLWGDIFNDKTGAILGDQGMKVFFNQNVSLADTAKTAVDLYMDLIYYDINGLTKFMLGLSGEQESQNYKEPKFARPEARDYANLVEKGKVIRFPVHMEVSARFE